MHRCYGNKADPAGVKGRYEGIMTMHPYKPRICMLNNEPKPSQRRPPANSSARAARAAQPKGVARPTKLYVSDTSVPTGQKSTALHEATLLRLSAARGLHSRSMDPNDTTYGKYSPHDMTAMGADSMQAPICMLLPRRVANLKESNDWKTEHHCSTAETGSSQDIGRKACFPCSAFQFLKDRHGPQAAVEWTAALAEATNAQLTKWQAPTRERIGAGISLATLGVVIEVQRPHPLAMMWDPRPGTQPQAIQNAYAEYAWNPQQPLYPLMQRHGVTFNTKAAKDPKYSDLPNVTAFKNAMRALRNKAALCTLHLACSVTIGKPCEVDIILPLISPDTPQSRLPEYLQEAVQAAEAAAPKEARGEGASGKGGSGGSGGKGAKGSKGAKGGKGDEGDEQPKSASGRRGFQDLEQEGEDEEEDGEEGEENGEIGEEGEDGGMDTELVATEQQMMEAAMAREAEEKAAAEEAEAATAAAVAAAVTAAAETATAAAEAPQTEASTMPAEAADAMPATIETQGTASDQTGTAPGGGTATEYGEEEDADPELLPDTEESSGKRAAETPLRGPPSKKSSRVPSRLPSRHPSRVASRDASQEREADELTENERAAKEIDSELQETIEGEVDLRQLPAGALSTHEQHSQEASSSMQAQQGGEHAANQRMPHIRRATRRGK